MFTSNIRIRKNCDLSDCDHGMIVGDRQADVSISETNDSFSLRSSKVAKKVFSSWCHKCSNEFTELQWPSSHQI